MYYLQSRYYNPEWGRFINADALVSTGQGILGNNMFAYCNNNPINSSDPGGTCALGLKNRIDNQFSVACNCCCGGAGGGSAALLGGIVLTEKILSGLINFARSIFFRSSDEIDWNGGNKNHILQGTKKKHIDGWRRFGIDPDNGNDDNNWAMLIPILQEVVDKADDVFPVINKNGTTCMYYVKIFVNEGVKVVVSIWESLDGAIHRISDAIPYIIN